jgi:ketosteroid isomerase-like protein
VHRFYEAYNSGDLEAIGAVVADDVVYHDMALYEEPFRGRQQVLEFMAKVRARTVMRFQSSVCLCLSADLHSSGTATRAFVYM